eukprot:m.142568 g.142568  ORF g.142568 m.142568 type:complete len:1264 (+) comp14880_c0_seq1:1287-5078(+)
MGKRFRKPKKVQGGSASSNPATHKFRGDVRHKLLATAGVGPQHKSSTRGPNVPRLTAKALETMETEGDNTEGEILKKDDMSDSDNEDEPEDIFATVRRKFNSQLEADKEICAVLAAVTETIKKQKQQETPTAYWAAFMSTLEQTGNDDVKAATALAYLLSLAFPKVPASVCQRHFGDASKIMMGKLKSKVEEGSQALIKNTMTCLAHLVANMDRAAWETREVQNVFQPLLQFSVDSRPKIRKASHSGMAMVLSSTNKAKKHPASVMAGQYCLEHLNKIDDQDTLYVLNLLKDTIYLYPVAQSKILCEQLLVLMAGGRDLVKSMCIGVLIGLFEADNADLPEKLLVQLIDALYQYKPDLSDIESRIQWNTLMLAAVGALSRGSSLQHSASLVNLCPVYVECFRSDRNKLVKSAAKCFETILDKHLALCLQDDRFAENQENISRIVSTFESALHYKYRLNFPQILPLVGKMFEVLGRKAIQLAPRVTAALVQLRSADTIDHRDEITRVLEAVVKACGPEHFLDNVPLNFQSETFQLEFPNSWALPLLKNSVTGATLESYGRLVPLAAHLLKMHLKAKEEGQDLIATTYKTLHIQVWELLPAFCNHATDVKVYFKNIARMLGSAITDREDLRGIVCSALVTLIKTTGTEGGTAVAAFGKNFLPILLNIFCGDKTTDIDRSHALAAIEAFVPIIDPSLASTLLQTVTSRLEEAKKQGSDEGNVAILNLMEIGIVMAGRADNVPVLYSLSQQFLLSENWSLQKKAFRGLAQVCSNGESDFLVKIADEIQSFIVKSMLVAAPAAKHHRLNAIGCLSGYLNSEQLERFIPEIIAEVILCCKEVNERAREAAFDCLITLGNAIWENQTGTYTLSNYVDNVVAGLAGQTPHMQSATIIALSRLLYQFTEEISKGQIEQILQSNCLLLQSNSREVLKSAIGLAKVAVVMVPLDNFEPFLPSYVENLVVHAGPAFRMRVRMIFERFIRKFGFEKILDLTPEDHKKMVLNIRKRKDREKRKAREAKESRMITQDNVQAANKHRKPTYEELINDSDDESEDETSNYRVNKVKGRPMGKPGRDMFIKEDDEDEPLNFLDARAASTKLRSTKPQEKKRKRKEEEPFPILEDGRMLVLDPEAKDAGRENADAQASLIQAVDDLDDGVTFGKGIHRDRASDRKKARRPWGQEEEDVESDEEDDRQSKSIKRVKVAGSEYRAKKARGDMTLAGKQQPYAYLPFDRSQLNRRKKAKAVGKFKSMVSGAQKGSKSGKKAFRRR